MASSAVTALPREVHRTVEMGAVSAAPVNEVVGAMFPRPGEEALLGDVCTNGNTSSHTGKLRCSSDTIERNTRSSMRQSKNPKAGFLWDS